MNEKLFSVYLPIL